MTARVLVVDDHLPNIKLLEAKLNSEYYEVLTAMNGADAIKIAQSEEPDIILLDVMMPEMDGFTACKKIKSDPIISHIPVVMVTALSDPEDRVQGLEAGADDFLTKPINDLALFARIRSLVRLKQLMDELNLRDKSQQQLGLTESSFKKNQDIDIMKDASILLVDDDIVQVRNAKKNLESLGAKVEIAQEPEEAMNIISRIDFDVAIISTQLLDSDGLRLCSQIRSQEHSRRLPLLMLIEESDTPLLVRGLDMGVNDYLMIPMDSNELVARVRTQIKRKHYQDALKSNYQKSVSLAITDALTGLYNRHYFDTHASVLLQQAHEQKRPLSFVISDIDFFKKVNDNYGHIAGDEVLKEVPKRILHCIRTTDLVARYGGEEFVIIMPDTPLALAKEIGERIRKEVEGSLFSISVPPHQIVCTMSLGIASILPTDTTPSILLKRADDALYQAKKQGRNRVVGEDEL